jgi:hypothetical protein
MVADGKEEKSNLTKHDGNSIRDAGLYKPHFLLLFLFVVVVIVFIFQIVIMAFFQVLAAWGMAVSREPPRRLSMASGQLFLWLYSFIPYLSI